MVWPRYRDRLGKENGLVPSESGGEMARKKISTTVYITQEQSENLKELHKKTKVPVAEYIREGIDLVLEKHKDILPGQISFVDKQ